MANYGQALEMARQLEARGGLPQGVTLAMMAQQLMGSEGAEQPPLPARGGMPAMTTGLLENVRAGAAAPVQGDPIAAETAARQARAAQAGGVSPEMEAIYAAREARIAKQDEDAPKDDRRAAWDALAQMGFKMAQTTSPYFATALAEGMQAGSQGYNAAKIAAAEKAARREEEKENVSLARLKDRQAAIAAAEAGYAADVGMAKDKATLSGEAAKAAQEQVKAEFASEMAELSAEEARAKVKERAADLGLTQAQTNKVLQEIKLAPGLAAAQMERDRRGGSEGEISQTSLFSALQGAKDDVVKTSQDVNAAIAEQQKANAENDAVASLAASQKARQMRAVYDAAVTRQREIERMMRGGGTPAPRASAKPAGSGADYTYVSGKGVVKTGK